MRTSFGFLFYFSSFAIFSILCLPWLFLDSFRRKIIHFQRNSRYVYDIILFLFLGHPTDLHLYNNLAAMICIYYRNSGFLKKIF